MMSVGWISKLKMIIIFIHFPSVLESSTFGCWDDNHGLLANVLNRFWPMDFHDFQLSRSGRAQVSWLCFAYVFSFAGAIFYAVQQTKLFVRANLQEVPLMGTWGDWHRDWSTGRLVMPSWNKTGREQQVIKSSSPLGDWFFDWMCFLVCPMKLAPFSLLHFFQRYHEISMEIPSGNQLPSWDIPTDFSWWAGTVSLSFKAPSKNGYLESHMEVSKNGGIPWYPSNPSHMIWLWINTYTYHLLVEWTSINPSYFDDIRFWRTAI